MKQSIQNNNLRRNSKKKEKAYFSSKSELLTWINSTLDLKIKGIEQTITGAIFCQLLDAAHPGTVRMNKVNWKAKLETEYIANFKIFQQGLSNNNIDKPINISRLSKGKTQELIELLQWLYGYHLTLGIDPSKYDAVKKRNGQNFIFSGDKVKNINVINNKNIRDDLSRCSSSVEFREYQMKNSFKNRNNFNTLNTNLIGDNFHTNNTYQNQIPKNTVIQNKKIKNIHEKYKNADSKSNYSRNLSVSSNTEKNEENSYKNINKNPIKNNPFIIDEKPEAILKENEDELNNILFDGISNVDKENILELEKKDGNNIHTLKILIRKLRVDSIIFRNNLGTILNKVTKERNFYLNKLKDIEYLYFNPIIRNTLENKNLLLKSILASNIDSTVIINDGGIASIKGKGEFPCFQDYSKKEDINKMDVEENNYNKDNARRSSQKVFCIKIFNKNEFEKENNSKIEQKLINKTQPDAKANQYNKTEKNNNEPFYIKSNILKSNKKKENVNMNTTPSNKTGYYDISSHILNEPLHIPNNENLNYNISNFD